MARCGWWFLLLVPAHAGAQTTATPYGLKLGKVPDAVYAHVPQLPKNQGVLVEEVAPNSPAWRRGLRPFDVIVSVDAKPQADPEVVGKKLGGPKPGHSAPVTLFRAGREMVLHADGTHKDNDLDDALSVPKGIIKPGGPPAVVIQLQPLDNGQLSLRLTYYSANSGKMEHMAYTGPLGDIERQIQQHARDKRFSDSVQDLVDVALKRVRSINQSQK
jgi:hypothetical protein